VSSFTELKVAIYWKQWLHNSNSRPFGSCSPC